jgi:hypothetical protein
MNTEKDFWSKVNKTDTCWEWTGYTNQAGYGQSTFDGKKYYVHRYSAVIHGIYQDGLLVCHHCDNRKCVNPDHLFMGTPMDNTQDMIKKGRRPNTSMDRRKLTDEEVREIRTSSLSCVKAGKKYGVGKSIIHHIRKGNTYRDVV